MNIAHIYAAGDQEFARLFEIGRVEHVCQFVRRAAGRAQANGTFTFFEAQSYAVFAVVKFDIDLAQAEFLDIPNRWQRRCR